MRHDECTMQMISHRYAHGKAAQCQIKNAQQKLGANIQTTRSASLRQYELRQVRRVWDKPTLSLAAPLADCVKDRRLMKSCKALILEMPKALVSSCIVSFFYNGLYSKPGNSNVAGSLPAPEPFGQSFCK